MPSFKLRHPDSLKHKKAPSFKELRGWGRKIPQGVIHKLSREQNIKVLKLMNI